MSDLTISAPALAHLDRIAPVIFSVPLISTAALVGRHLARKLQQPTVLGELLMGILLDNLLYFYDSERVLILRKGTVVMQVAQYVLSGCRLGGRHATQPQCNQIKTVGVWPLSWSDTPET